MSPLKRILSILLMLIFFFSTTGISIYKHYCGDFLEGISVYHKDNPCEVDGDTDGCSMGSSMSCCKDDFQFLKLKTDLQKVSTQKVEFKIIKEALTTSCLVVPELLNEDSSTTDLVLNHGPPLAVPLYKKYSRLTYYG